ncbi:MAG: ParB/RepB/Spo0J family partition protein [Chromatiales bacterium]|nr:ParB/RepB/Spo0J family partition protein [Chromatiales bacterium]
MSTRKRGLGRGLDALLGGAVAASAPTPAAGERVLQLGVDQLRRGRFQPRGHFDQEALEELAESIRAQGLVQPIVARPVDADRYEIIAGERRWRAAQIAGLKDVPVVVRDVPDQAAMAMALIENIQREDLNPLEEATALSRLQREFELTHQQIAETVGKSRATVTNLLRLLELNLDVKERLDRGDIEMGHARALLALNGQAQSDAARHASEQGLSVRQTEALVRRLANPQPAAAKPARDPNVERLQHDLGERLGAKVEISSDPKGRGRLVIGFNSLDELDGILAHIR